MGEVQEGRYRGEGTGGRGTGGEHTGGEGVMFFAQKYLKCTIQMRNVFYWTLRSQMI